MQVVDRYQPIMTLSQLSQASSRVIPLLRQHSSLDMSLHMSQHQGQVAATKPPGSEVLDQARSLVLTLLSQARPLRHQANLKDLSQLMRPAGRLGCMGHRWSMSHVHGSMLEAFVDAGMVQLRSGGEDQDLARLVVALGQLLHPDSPHHASFWPLALDMMPHIMRVGVGGQWSVVGPGQDSVPVLLICNCCVGAGKGGWGCG